MLTHHAAFELSRERVRQAEERATLMNRLGDLPKPMRLSLFRREVKPLAGIVEVRRGHEREHFAGRPVELSTAKLRTERRAS